MNDSNDRVARSARRRPTITTLHLLIGLALTVAAAFGAVQAWATPGQGASSVYVARGTPAQEIALGVPRTVTVSRTVRVRVGRKVVRKRVSFKVNTLQRVASCGASGGCDIVFQQLTIAPGGHTGWHTHPGPTFVAVAQGEGTLYHGTAGCPAHKYGANSGFYQPSTEVHNMRNEGSVPLVIYSFYALAPGTTNPAIRTDQPQPAACPNIP